MDENEFYIALAGEFSGSNNFVDFSFSSKDERKAIEFCNGFGGCDTIIFKCRVNKEGVGPGFVISPPGESLSIGIDTGNMKLTISGEEI